MKSRINQKIDLSDGITLIPQKVDSEERYVEGVLYKNAVGRYEINKDYGLYAGSEIELNLCGTWVKTTIDISYGNKYYAKGLKGLVLAGLKVRIKI